MLLHSALLAYANDIDKIGRSQEAEPFYTQTRFGIHLREKK
jgi:hypothetical protein